MIHVIWNNVSLDSDSKRKAFDMHHIHCPKQKKREMYLTDVFIMLYKYAKHCVSGELTSFIAWHVLICGNKHFIFVCSR